MHRFRRWTLPLAVGLLALAGKSQEVGSRIPATLELEGYAGIPVTSFSELAGRAVLLEFFAYW